MFTFIYSFSGALFSSLIIFLIFRILHFIASRFMNRVQIKQKITSALFGLEFIVWLVLIYRIAEHSFSTKPILSFVMILLLAIIVSWAFWFILRDYMAGLYIRSMGRIKLKQSIAFDDVEGRIIEFANNYLVLETINKGIVEIPYSKLLAKNIEFLQQSAEEELLMSFELKNSKDEEAFIQKIISGLHETPWVNHRFEPQITTKKVDGKTYVELKIILHDKKYRKQVKEVLGNLS